VLGGLLADAADIKTEAEAAKAVLIGMAAQDLNICAFEGDLFRATVTFADKRKVNYKAILAALVRDGFASQNLIDSLIEQNTETAEGVPTVRCTSRKGI
jgi:hypothetical protein